MQQTYIYAFTLQESCEELNECLWYTKRINWDNKALVVTLDSSFVKHLNKFFNCHNFEFNEDDSDICMWLPKEKAELFDYT